MFEYKYRTKSLDGGWTLVMRTHVSNPWPRDELDMETLEVDCADRREALRLAKGCELACWG